MASLLLTACSGDEVPMFGSVYGTVKDAVSGEAVRNAAVTVSPGNYTYTTGSDGQFQFSDLEAGTYTVQCVANDYNTNSRQVTIYAGGNTTCDFLMTKQTSTSSIVLSTNSIDFGTSSTEEIFSITNTGNSGTVSWNISNPTVSWLSVTPVSGTIAQGKSSSITVSVDRSKITKEEQTYLTVNAAGGSLSIAIHVQYGGNDDGNNSGNGNNGNNDGSGSGSDTKGEAVVGFNTSELDFGTTENELTLLVGNLEEATANLRWELDKEYPNCLSFSMNSGELEPGYYHTVVVGLNRDKMTSDIDTQIKIYDLADNYNYYYPVNVKAKMVVKEDYSSATVQSCDNRITAEIVSCKRSGGSVVFEYRLTNVDMGYINDWRIYPTNSMSLMSGCYRSTVADNVGNEYFYSLFAFRDASGKTNVVSTAFPDGMTCKGSVTVYDVDTAATKLSIMLGVAAYNHSKQLADNRIYFKNVPIY